MSVEKRMSARSGWGMLALGVALLAVGVAGIVYGAVRLEAGAAGALGAVCLVAGCVVTVAAIVVMSGLFSLQPGQTRVCVLFGRYVGTVRDAGFHWANPFYAHSLGYTETETSEDKRKQTAVPSKVSVRARTLNSDHLKVNDKMGNPIEIANVVVWHVEDTAKAVFDVDDYEQFVSMQSETALRHVASVYAYDHMGTDDDADDASAITLRSNVAEVSDALREELGRRLAPAGVAIDDARLTHLAYAPEIAQAMLRRQQAEAVIAARRKIVEGAVSMVNMAVEELAQSGTIDLDDERKAAMASNLMVVLCGENDAQPVLNAGTLYQ
ncbi:SPFH domain-containing protein [bacterium]|nr:SPFH domain-containing protein [bacterium]